MTRGTQLSPSNPHFVRNLLEYEIERLRPDPIQYYEPGTSEAQLLNWIRSTPARRLFATLMVRAAMDDEYQCASTVRNECKLSRPAFNEICNQCEDAGWIDVERNEQGLRFIKGAQILVDLWDEYARVLGNIVINRLPDALRDVYVRTRGDQLGKYGQHSWFPCIQQDTSQQLIIDNRMSTQLCTYVYPLP